MKKLILITLVGLVWQISLSAQDGKTAPGDDGGHPCPVGMCVTRATLYIDAINFHKPRTGCVFGFGCCIKVHWEYTCGFSPNCMGSVNTGYKQATKVENGKVSGWFNVSKGKAELHLPLALENEPSFTGTDFSVFHLDPDMVFLQNEKGVVTGKLKAGAYPVKRIAGDFVILVDVE